MTLPRSKTASLRKAIGIIVLLGIGILAWVGFRQMREAKEYSAQAALASEIQSNLVFLHYNGTAFPHSLSELPLRYPDGGNASLLNRFQYTSFGTACTVRTRMPFANKDTEWSF
jgi:hypothetical protein